MQDTSNIGIKITDGGNSIAVAELGSHVLGGNDALAFTSRLVELTSSNVKLVIVDMHNVEAMNSSGLGMLAAGLTTMKKYNVNLVLVSVPDKIMSLLKMTHLDRVFTIYASYDEALVSVK